jgi:hypothetical protein
MFAVFAAEQQYHHDTRTRERDRRILMARRERAAVAQADSLTVAPMPSIAVAPARLQRAAWARPIGQHAHDESALGCALA